ncbi:hypothetical protein ACFTTN_29155 [Streptomyces niveus]|uniref:hypothetical protein n=1 Tax=Streptomyces niveus TaxID=193462 RepID=UPI00362EFB42
MRTTTAVIAAVLLLTTLTACSSDSKSDPEAKPSPTPTRSMDAHDCKALLERDYASDELRDATREPECAHLTQDEYAEIVGDVIGGHKDEILDQAAQEVAWDEAWDATDADQQELVCGRLFSDGAVVVGQEMMDDGGGMDDAAGNPVDMAQYFLDEKC